MVARLSDPAGCVSNGPVMGPDDPSEPAADPAAHRVRVLLADDNLIVREGVRALLRREPDLEVVAVAADLDELIAAAADTAPDVVVTDIRMPPNFQREGIDGAKEIRKRRPGTGVVILSQYDDPEYAVSLLSGGSAGYGYLLKDRIAEDDGLAQAVRRVATGGTVLDQAIADALVQPVTTDELTGAEQELLAQVANGRTIKAIAAWRGTTPAAVADDIERLFLRLAQSASAGTEEALRQLRLLHQAIVDREEQGETLSRLLPGGVAELVLDGGHQPGESQQLEVTVLMSDIRGYTTIAEHADPATLAGQLNTHRARMNDAILSCGGTVMQYVGDAVMAVFGAPLPQEDHAENALRAALAMHVAQAEVNAQWAAADAGLLPFGIGIGLSTGTVAAALLGSSERLEYTVVGDAVNLSQRLQQLATPGETVLSAATMAALPARPDGAFALDAQLVKGRETPVEAWKLPAVTP